MFSWTDPLTSGKRRKESDLPSAILTRMLMVILGAGASYDSSPDFVPDAALRTDGGGGPWRPPLANDLFRDRSEKFGEIVVKYPKLTQILPYLRSPSAGGVEQTLELLQDQGKNDRETQRSLAAVKFYLCDLLMKVTEKWTSRTNGVTNYVPLIREILRLDQTAEEVCLVTFNYDLLLERALVSFPDFEMKGPEEFLSCHPRLKIFKLHGSVNWSRTVGTSGALYSPNQIIEQADFLHPSDRFVPINAAREFGAGRPYGSVFPAIAIPVQTKTEGHFECPSAHREHLIGMLPRITKILIIGWQAKEAHFLQMLRGKLRKLQRVMVVGAHKPDAEGTLRHFLEEYSVDVRSPSAAKGGFTSFIVNHEGDEFLAAQD